MERNKRDINCSRQGTCGLRLRYIEHVVTYVPNEEQESSPLDLEQVQSLVACWPAERVKLQLDPAVQSSSTRQEPVGGGLRKGCLGLFIPMNVACVELTPSRVHVSVAPE